MKILVVDDDPDLRDLIGYTLRRDGYFVIEAEDGIAALLMAEVERPDLVLLDVNLPRLDGFEVCRRLRAASAVPIVMLTVRGAEEDQVRGLDLGADDYLAKPFSPRTLLARVRALLRRAGGAERPQPLAVGDLLIDAEAQTVRVQGAEPVRLTRLEFRLLQLLAANAGSDLPFERLLRHVWGDRISGDRQALKQLVHRLRQKIEKQPAAPRYLHSASGVGYRLEPTAARD
ncbi:MAG TPA: response regulator transcription factor [Thermoanaerobaculia bacterium]|jgi:DNA-binding response OmpR family regulator|nr:response regulator transcription factor [Thermoanaerobaculia bacterium]